MGDYTLSNLLMLIIAFVSISLFALLVLRDDQSDGYQHEVETCRAHYSTSLEELTKCLDIQLENKE